MQMYKVFVNDCPIILTDIKNVSTNFKIRNIESIDILELVAAIFKDEVDGICLYCNNLDVSWKNFKAKFKIQKAAGGKVFNSQNEVLFIYRFNKWDLPKGKLEKGESIQECAVREVEEECGVRDLEIQKPLETTYHIFERKNKIILKITYWYLMTTTYNGELTPQLEEDIQQVVFKNKIEAKKALKKSYENIKLLF
tara:strand:- start:14321 stop:14908 length:588 start_codon:yes stop_codon:yes gene_type:complete